MTDGEDVLLADDPDVFAAHVGRLLDDPSLACRLGTAARRLVEARYSWQSSVCTLESFYRDIIAH